MQSKEQDNLIFLRLFPKEDVYSALKKACREHQVKTAVIISGIGQLKSFELGFFKEKGNYLPEKFTSPHELVSLSGNVSLQNNEYNFHLHAILGNADKQVVAGHFISGEVSVTGEIILLKTDLNVRREIEPETGLQGLFLR